MARQLLAASLALTAAVILSQAEAGVIDYDMSPVCQQYLPQCQAQCTRSQQDFIFVCSAGSGPNGGPLVKCNCVVPQQPAGGPSQVALMSLTDWPGAQKCKQKTWLNDCGTTLRATINGTSADFTPTITQAFGNPCNPQGGVVVGPRSIAIAFPEYPLGVMQANPDGSVSIRFAPFEDGSQDCYAIYKVVQGSLMNGTLPTQTPGSALALPGAQAAVDSTAADGSGAPAGVDLAAVLNSVPTSLPSTLLSGAMLVLALIAVAQLL